MSSRSNLHKKFILIPLLLGLLFQVFNTAFFIHFHKLANGDIIVHAHPFNKEKDNQPFKTHHHTSQELILFQQFQLLHNIQNHPPALITCNQPEKLFLPPVLFIDSAPIALKTGRSPPSLIVCFDPVSAICI